MRGAKPRHGSLLYKKLVLVTVATMALAASAALDGSSKGTCTWIGPATGGNWNDAANWSTDSQSYTVAQLLATNCIYVISDLADGAVLINNMVDRPICGITFSPSAAATVTLQGENALWRGQTEFNIASNGKVVWKMNHPQDWNNKDGNTKVLILGEGTLALDPTSDMTFYQREIQPCHSTTLELGAKCFFNLTYIRQWNTSKVRLIGQEVSVAQLIATDSGCSLDLNGNTLYICGGQLHYAYAMSGRTYYAGTISGTGNIAISGGQTYSVSGSWADYSGSLALWTSSIDFRSGFTFPAAVEPIVSGSGSLNFLTSQTLCGLRGEGVTGGVTMSDGTTLTLSKGANASAVFSGRIAGCDVAKIDADYEQVLTGDNVYTGSTTVAEGTLTLRRPIARKGLVAYWPFDDATDLGRDYGPNGFNLSFCSTDNAVATQCVSTVTSRPAVDLAGNAQSGAGSARFECGGLTRAKGFPVGNDAVSISLWAKPRGTNAHKYVLRYGDWSKNRGQMTLWFYNDNVITCVDNWSTSDGDNSPMYSAPDLRDGNWHHFAITYADRRLSVYYDGVLKKQKTITSDLSISDNTTIVFGNNDTSTQGEPAHRYHGGIDEAIILDYELTAEEVAAEFARNRAPVTDPAAVLPDPVCHWAFDDDSAPGKDSAGTADLDQTPGISVVPTLAMSTYSYGKYLATNASMRLPVAKQPASFPTGKAPFTVSVRFCPNGPQENFDVLRFGETPLNLSYPATTTNGFRLCYMGCPRSLRAVFGGKVIASTRSDNSSNDKGSWSHVVVVCDPAARLMRFFRDGRLETTVTDLAGTTFVKAGDLVLNANPYATKATNVMLDDVRLYDRALTIGVAIALSRSLKTGSVGPIVPATSPVTVAAGATINVEGEGHEFKSLAGAGTVALKGPARLKMGDAASFTGTVTGPGMLELAASIGGTVSSDVELAEGGVFSLGSLPLVTTTGLLKIPPKGQIDIGGVMSAGSYVIARGGQVEAAAGFESGWTVSKPGVKAKFMVKDGDFILRCSGGLIMIFR